MMWCDLVLRGDGEHAGHQQQAGGEEAARHADDRPLGLPPPDGLSPLPLPLLHSPGICIQLYRDQGDPTQTWITDK